LDVQVYSTDNLEFAERELLISELPPIPEGFQEALTEAGGYCDNKPNVRVVSGLDENLVEFYGGKWWRKYAFREHRVNEYAVWHKPDGSKKILSPKEADILGRSKSLTGVILPVVDRQTIEYGIPRYFIEYYKPPELFGNPELWEAARFDPQDDGTILDLMGEFPSEGVYETWFAVEEPVIDEKTKVVTGTEFRKLDEIVLEFVIAKIEEVKTKSAAKQHAEVRAEVDQDYRDKKAQLKEDIADIVRDHVDRLID
jgi:hypothetical protein